MKQIFISDLHLDAQHENITRAFLTFLRERCADAHQLYILGDLFEVWLGDDHDSAFNRRILAALASFKGELFLMHGNRDFLIGEAFCRAAGAMLLADPTVLDLTPGKTLLTHGDSLCTRDTAYMTARKQLRSSAFQADLLARSINERAAFAAEMRGKSRQHTRETAMDIMDVTQEEVVRMMTRAGVKTMIHGHTHRPARHDVKLGDGSGSRYVLGDWQTSTQYLQVESDRVSLELYEFS